MLLKHSVLDNIDKSSIPLTRNRSSVTSRPTGRGHRWIKIGLWDPLFLQAELSIVELISNGQLLTIRIKGRFWVGQFVN